MTIQTTESSFQTLDLAQLDTVTGGGIIGAGIKILAKGANKARQAWPGIQKKATSSAKWLGGAAASGVIGDTTMQGINWAREKLSGGR